MFVDNPKMDEVFFHSIPTDCLHWIVSFLPLRHCFAFGCSSKQYLTVIQPELRLRRKRFTQIFYYTSIAENPKVFGPIDSARNLNSNGNKHIYYLPTVLNRIESLQKALSVSHPLAVCVDNLRRAILEIGADDEDLIKRKDVPVEKMSFQATLETHKNLILPFKLHTTILDKSVKSNPEHQDLGYKHGISGGSHSNGGKVLTITLNRYIGDVLCAFYRMGHSAANIIEGGPTESDWIEAIKSELPCLTIADGLDEFEVNIPVGVSASTWYRCWILVHSSLLRIGHFTSAQQIRLGIATLLPHAGGSNAVHDSLLIPHHPFIGCGKKSLLRRLSLVANFEALRVTYNDFGPLGPSFRGRDLIQSHTIYPASAIGVIIHFESFNTNLTEYEEYIQHGILPAQSSFLRQWISGQDAVIHWLFELHEESNKSRPITVASPIITIRCSSS